MEERLVAIVGTTGVGKSQLGVELSKALNGEVINADSMQVYQELDIITNKITETEREGVPHHLMDFLLPHQEYKVTEFEIDAIRIISDVNRRNRLPIVVGGTNYYIQSLLWRDSLVKSPPTAKNVQDTPSSSPPSSSTEGDELDVDAPTLYERLKEVDPVMANRWHPSDRRKIRRSLETYLQTGKRHSEIIKEQHEQEAKASKLRFKTCIFWLYANPTQLNPRLDTRIDKMIQTGLFDEIQSLRSQVDKGSVRMPGTEDEKYQRGIWQAIGYKEFDPYFSALESQASAESSSAGPVEAAQTLESLKANCTETMKAATRRYAKKQVAWIRNKLLPIVWASQDEGAESVNVRLYLLDATSLEHWNENVRDMAVRLARDFFSNNPTPDPTTINSVAREMLKVVPTVDTATRIFSWQKYACEICTTDAGHPTVVNGDEEWKQHIRSRWHRKNAARRKKEANGDEAGKRKRDRGATVTTGSTEMVATSDGQGLGIGCERED